MTVIEMSCVEVWREISNFLEEWVDPELRGRMEAHFALCSNCKAVLDGTKNVVKLIADGQTFEVPAGFSERLFSVSSADQAAVWHLHSRPRCCSCTSKASIAFFGLPTRYRSGFLR